MSSNPYNKDKRLLELLEQWQTGQFTRADEQELQTLTDSDEFRREAVEGFWALPEADHATHLASIRERLRRRTGGMHTGCNSAPIHGHVAISALALYRGSRT